MNTDYFIQDSTTRLKSLYFERSGKRLSEERERTLASVISQFFFDRTQTSYTTLTYEMLDPVESLPRNTQGFDNQTKARDEILARVGLLPDGCWLPVVFQTEEQAFKFAYNRIRPLKGVELKKRRQVIFIRSKKGGL